MTVLALAQVRMTTCMVGVPTLDAGEVVGLPLEQARRWVEAGIAEWWDDPLIEAAVDRGAPERAVRGRARGRG